MLRKLFYSLPTSWRFWARRLVFLPTDILRPQKGYPPKGLIYTGGGDFAKQGQNYVDLFIEKGGLKTSDHFLDIGSGIGRVAIPLAKYLAKNTTYEGFDVVKLGVSWCQKNVSSKHPNFTFTYVDLLNDLYRADGDDAATYEFPYQANSFQFACSMSVFTHMLPNEVKNYFQELYKVLSPGGRIFASFFIINPETNGFMDKQNHFVFKHKKENYYLMDEQVKGANVAFDESYLLSEIVDPNQFSLVYKNYGFWSGRNKANCDDFQDVLILEKR